MKPTRFICSLVLLTLPAWAEIQTNTISNIPLVNTPNSDSVIAVYTNNGSGLFGIGRTRATGFVSRAFSDYNHQFSRSTAMLTNFTGYFSTNGGGLAWIHPVGGDVMGLVGVQWHNETEPIVYWGNSFLWRAHAWYLDEWDAATAPRVSWVFGEVDPYSWNLNASNLVVGADSGSQRAAVEYDRTGGKSLRYGNTDWSYTELRAASNVLSRVGTTRLVVSSNGVGTTVGNSTEIYFAGVATAGITPLSRDSAFTFNSTGKILTLGETGTSGKLDLYDGTFDETLRLTVDSGLLQLAPRAGLNLAHAYQTNVNIIRGTNLSLRVGTTTLQVSTNGVGTTVGNSTEIYFAGVSTGGITPLTSDPAFTFSSSGNILTVGETGTSGKLDLYDGTFDETLRLTVDSGLLQLAPRAGINLAHAYQTNVHIIRGTNLDLRVGATRLVVSTNGISTTVGNQKEIYFAGTSAGGLTPVTGDAALTFDTTDDSFRVGQEAGGSGQVLIHDNTHDAFYGFTVDNGVLSFSGTLAGNAGLSLTNVTATNLVSGAQVVSAAAPSDTITPDAWFTVKIGGTSYRVPLYSP